MPEPKLLGAVLDPRFLAPPTRSPEEMLESHRAMLAERAARHEAEQLAQTRTHLELCGVLRREAQAALGDLAETPALKRVRLFATTPSALMLVLWGGVGCGKSVAAAWWLTQARRTIENDDVGRSWIWDRKARLVKASHLAKLSEYDAKDRADLEAVKRLRWLVVDDLGAEFKSEVFSARMDELVDARNSNRLRTVITTNLTCKPDPAKGERVSLFEARYGDRLVSRVEQDGEFYACGRTDLRREP